MKSTSQAWLAIGAAVACLAATAMGFLLPWMSTGELEVSRGDLAGGNPYERALVNWPATALPLAAAALGAACWATLTKSHIGPRVRRTALLATFAAATVAGVAATRLLGLQVARSLDPGDPVLTLQVSSYATMAAALLAAVAAIAMASSSPPGSRPWPGKGGLAAAVSLLALPLVPFGVGEGRFALHYDELLLAIAADLGSGDLAEAGRALAWIRTLLWSAAALALAVALAAAWAPWEAWLRRWGALAAVPVLAGASALAATFQWKLWHLDGIRPGWNYVAIAGAIVALALQAHDCATAWRAPAQGKPGPAAMADAAEPSDPHARKA